MTSADEMWTGACPLPVADFATFFAGSGVDDEYVKCGEWVAEGAMVLRCKLRVQGWSETRSRWWSKVKSD